jgi:glucose/arabinose dehydrogenase
MPCNPGLRLFCHQLRITHYELRLFRKVLQMKRLLSFAIVALFVFVILLASRATLFAQNQQIYLPIVLNNHTQVAWPAVALEEVATGFDLPVHVTHAGDGTGRLFVVEQRGSIRLIVDGERLATPFLDIRDRVTFGGERGLLSVAFPPGFEELGHFYVNYTATVDNQLMTRISRFQVGSSPNQADPESEQIVLTIDQFAGNHNGGQIAFGPDGYLFIGMGDGGGSGDPQNHGQRPETLLGAMLRIDVESGSPLTYTIPVDNPFMADSVAAAEVWSYGLRNPWRFSFDRQTGDLYIADVGQGAWEEINVQSASSQGGENYGWNIMEGTHCYNAATCDQTGLTLPVWEYGRSEGQSITGGFVYRGSAQPSLQGIYFYGDYLSGRLWGLQQVHGAWQNQLFLETNKNISSFGEDETGELYLVDYSGAIYRLDAEQ